MGLGIPPRTIKIMLESKPLKSTILVGRLGVTPTRRRPRSSPTSPASFRYNCCLGYIFVLCLLLILLLLSSLLLPCVCFRGVRFPDIKATAQQADFACEPPNSPVLWSISERSGEQATLLLLLLLLLLPLLLLMMIIITMIMPLFSISGEQASRCPKTADKRKTRYPLG